MAVFFRIFSGYLIVAMFVISCKTYRINNFNTVIKKEQKAYKVFIDTQQVVFSTTFINKENVKISLLTGKTRRYSSIEKLKILLLR